MTSSYYSQPSRWRGRLGAGLLLAGSLLALAPQRVAAQEVKLANVETWSFTGLRAVGDRYYYLLRAKRNSPGNFDLVLFDRELKQLSATPISIGSLGSLKTTMLLGDAALFYFDIGNKAQLVKFDAAGQKVKETTFPADDVFGSIVQLTPVGAGGDFYLAYPIQTGKKGFVVARYGADLTVKWQKEYAPEKGKYQLKQLATSEGVVGAVSDNSKDGLEAIGLDGATGTEKFRTVLPTTDNGVVNDLRTEAALVDKAGRLVVAGTFDEKGTKHPPGTPYNGFFVTVLTPAGQPEAFTRSPYTADLVRLLNPHSTLGVVPETEQVKLHMHQLTDRAGGGYTLLGETYFDLGVGGQPNIPNSGSMRRTVLDFAVVQITPKGQFETVKRIAKPFKVYEQAQALGRFDGPEDFGTRRVFSLRALQQPDPAKEPQLVLLNWHLNQYYVNTVSLSDRRDNLFTRRYLDLPVVAAEQERGELSSVQFIHGPNQNADELAYTDILPHAPGKVLYYHYDKVFQSLEMRVVELGR